MDELITSSSLWFLWLSFSLCKRIACFFTVFLVLKLPSALFFLYVSYFTQARMMKLLKQYILCGKQILELARSPFLDRPHLRNFCLNFCLNDSLKTCKYLQIFQIFLDILFLDRPHLRNFCFNYSLKTCEYNVIIYNIFVDWPHLRNWASTFASMIL